MRRLILSIGVLAVLGAAGCREAQQTRAPAGPAAEYVIASGEEAAAPFIGDDEFMGALTPADLSIRLRRNDAPTVADLRDFYRANFQEWNADERTRLQAAIERLTPRLAGLGDWLPDRILLVKVSPEFESGLPHTRGAAISMGAQLPASDSVLDSILLHETFHVLSRANPARRDDLYGVIGFVRCTTLTLPADVRPTMFTNPDAPIVAHAAPISATDPTLLATPILVADPPRYDPTKAHIFDYFHVTMMPLRRDAGGACTPAGGVTMGGQEMEAAIYAHAGRNTDYIFHPEELMADNFEQMMMGRADAPNPEIYDRLAAVLGIERPAAAPAPAP